MALHRPAVSAQTGYLLATALLLGVGTAAVVSRNESRTDFIIRRRVGDFDVDAPPLRPPDFDFDGPNINGPDINGPQVNAPQFTFWDVLYTMFIAALFIALIVGLILVLRRFGPGARDDAINERTTRLSLGRSAGPGPEGEQGWAAFERFCYDLLRDPDPSRAVRVIMRFSETGMGRLPYRIADETPNEWLRRVGRDHADLATHLGPIVASYNSVRFGGYGASPAERDRAVDGLRLLARTACGEIAPEAPGTIGATDGPR